MLASNVDTGLRLAIVDDRLRGQVDDGVDLVFAEHALQQRLVAHVAADDLHPFELPRPHQLALRHPVAHQADDVGARRRRGARTSQEPTRPVAPVTSVGRSTPEGLGRRHCQTFQGALPG